MMMLSFKPHFFFFCSFFTFHYVRIFWKGYLQFQKKKKKKIPNDDAERWSITCTQCEDMAYEDNKLYFYLLHKANRDHTSYKSILFKHTKKGEAT